ncbi:hypothetical protein P5G51_018095 [Virgibacillus sp. 179-BFC.A HS]|uniref:Uncharacterized protein n=1 Tax=Tigheibacillus jepli TaxID=3035914 RepID=A0ABU5CKZ9_9BACI|nr:hypothetical protein [Virgibacillus sp. 179-BFC.A HS]MDY0406995.1 hypothetical protein [Virgibacillus sp. 179-BFC.A HS]
MNQLYNGKKKLIYAQFDMDDFYGDQRENSKLEISILDKQSKKSQSFETAIPDLQQYFSISVEALHPEKTI